MSSRVAVEVVDGCLVALEAVDRGAVVGIVDGPIVATPTRATLQLDAARHVDVRPPFLFLDHACEPNVAFETETLTIRAIVGIAAGDRLRLFYPSTEWDMAAVFACHCGSARCLGTIRGAKFLDGSAVLARGASAFVRGQIERA